MWIRKRTYYATLHAKDVIIQRLHNELAAARARCARLIAELDDAREERR